MHSVKVGALKGPCGASTATFKAFAFNAREARELSPALLHLAPVGRQGSPLDGLPEGALARGVAAGRGRQYASRMRPRYWLPCLIAFACLIATGYVGSIVAWVLIIVAFVLVFEAGTAWFANATSTGGMSDYKQ